MVGIASDGIMTLFFGSAVVGAGDAQCSSIGPLLTNKQTNKR